MLALTRPVTHRVVTWPGERDLRSAVCWWPPDPAEPSVGSGV